MYYHFQDYPMTHEEILIRILGNIGKERREEKSREIFNKFIEDIKDIDNSINIVVNTECSGERFFKPRIIDDVEYNAEIYTRSKKYNYIGCCLFHTDNVALLKKATQDIINEWHKFFTINGYHCHIEKLKQNTWGD